MNSAYRAVSRTDSGTPNSFLTNATLASVSKQMGKTEQAREKYQHIIKTHSEKLGENHSEIIRAKMDLSLLMQQDGDESGSRSLMQQVMAGRGAMLPRDTRAFDTHYEHDWKTTLPPTFYGEKTKNKQGPRQHEVLEIGFTSSWKEQLQSALQDCGINGSWTINVSSKNGSTYDFQWYGEELAKLASIAPSFEILPRPEPPRFPLKIECFREHPDTRRVRRALAEQ